MQQKVLDTLFYPFESGFMPALKKDARVAFLNAQYHPTLKKFKTDKLFLQQYFKPFSKKLEQYGFHPAANNCIEESANYDLALLSLPKNMIEAEYSIALCLNSLCDGGTLCVAADNKAGGARLEKIFSAFGLQNICSESKNKCRVVWGIKKNCNIDTIKAALDAGAMQQISLQGNQFYSQAGLFGWNKIDKGSELLLQHLPDDLSGKGADFGCGYGYLSTQIVQHKNITKLFCIDADFRALEACKLNLKIKNCNIKTEFLWEDLRQPSPDISDLDFVIMNPPFHEGKHASEDIGLDFIKTAAHSLRSGGKLYMVANRQLSYEPVLNSLFQTCSKLYEGQGFKVFSAKA